MSIGWFFAILAIAALIYIGWLALRGRLNAPTPAPVYVPPPPPLETHVELELPSSLPHLHFKCKISINYRVDGVLPQGRNAEAFAQSIAYKTAERVTSQYPVTVGRHLSLMLDDELNKSRTVADGSLTISARCQSVTVDPKVLRMAEELGRRQFELEMEEHLEHQLARRVERMSRLISDPRSAALWWLANHPDRIEELPRMTETMFALDQQLNHRLPGMEFHVGANGSAPSEPSHGQDLDTCLAHADEETRALIGNALAFAYDRLGRAAMAERARKLTDLVEHEETPEP